MGVTTRVSALCQATVTWVAGWILSALTTAASLCGLSGSLKLRVMAWWGSTACRWLTLDATTASRPGGAVPPVSATTTTTTAAARAAAAPKLPQIASRRGAPRGWRVCRGARTVRASAMSRARRMGGNLGSRSGSGRLSRTA